MKKSIYWCMTKLHVITYFEEEDMWSREFMMEEIDEVLKMARQDTFN